MDNQNSDMKKVKDTTILSLAKLEALADQVRIKRAAMQTLFNDYNKSMNSYFNQLNELTTNIIDICAEVMRVDYEETKARIETLRRLEAELHNEANELKTKDGDSHNPTPSDTPRCQYDASDSTEAEK